MMMPFRIETELGLPVVNFLVDHPYLHHLQFSIRLDVDVYIVCLDENHKEYIDRYYPFIKGSTTAYVLSEQIPRDEMPPKSRDILFLASYTDENAQLERINSQSPWLRKTAIESLDLLLSSPDLTVEAAISSVLGPVFYGLQRYDKFPAGPSG